MNETPMNNDQAEELSWLVLVNERGQYSLWPALSPVPLGWTECGPEGDEATCMAWIDSHWTDMRPRGVT